MALPHKCVDCKGRTAPCKLARTQPSRSPEGDLMAKRATAGEHRLRVALLDHIKSPSPPVAAYCLFKHFGLAHLRRPDLALPLPRD